MKCFMQLWVQNGFQSIMLTNKRFAGVWWDIPWSYHMNIPWVCFVCLMASIIYFHLLFLFFPFLLLCWGAQAQTVFFLFRFVTPNYNEPADTHYLFISVLSSPSLDSFFFYLGSSRLIIMSPPTLIIYLFSIASVLRPSILDSFFLFIYRFARPIYNEPVFTHYLFIIIYRYTH